MRELGWSQVRVRGGRRPAAGLGGECGGARPCRRRTSSSSTTRRGRSCPPRLIDRTIAAAVEHGAAIAALPVRRHGQAGRRRADRSVAADRRDACHARTSSWRRRRRPSAATCCARARDRPRARRSRRRDEAMLAERAGWPVHLVDGDAANIKITTAEDFERGTSAARTARASAIGTGYDLHRLVEGRPLILGGVDRPVRRGPRRPFRRRHRLPRGDRRGARRGGRRRHRAAVSRHRSAVEGRRQPEAAARRRRAPADAGLPGRRTSTSRSSRNARSCCRTSTAMRANLAAALEVDAGSGQHQGQDQRGGGQHRPRRVDGLPRGRAGGDATNPGPIPP